MSCKVLKVAAGAGGRSAPSRSTSRTPSKLRIRSSGIRPCLCRKVSGMQERAGRGPMVIGATIAARRREVLTPPGDTTAQGRVFRVPLPTVGSS